MKVLAGLVLILCLTGSAVGQVSSECSARISNQTATVTQLSSECQSELSTFLSIFSSLSTMGVSQDSLDSLCASSCVQQIGAIFDQECGLPFVRIICSRDDVGYCASPSGRVRIQAQFTAANTACADTNCITDANCNAAYQSASCCVPTSLELATSNIPLPEGCSFPEVCAGGMAVFAMPAVIIVSLLAALLVLF